MLDVSTMTQRRKSTSRPWRSVRRPSSKTCRKMSRTGCAAFSNSSSRITAKGSLRTDEISVAPCPSTTVSLRSRSNDSCVWYSLMSSRISRSGEPKRNSASAFAISVFPVPVGPTKRKTPNGRVGSVTPALIIAIRSTMQSTASRCSRTRRAKNVRTSSSGSGAAASSRASGSPELAAIVVSASRASKWSCSSSAASAAVGVDEAEQVPGLRDTGEKLLSELQGLDERLVVGLDLQSVVLERVSRDCDRRRVVEGPDTHDLECALDPRSGGEHQLCGGWGDLGKEGYGPGLDVR